MIQATHSFLPKLSQKGLFILAAIIWLISGTMLISKGFQFLPEETVYQHIKIPVAFVAGLIFYYFVFRRILVKYYGHILSLSPKQKHPFYKVFRIRFYIMISIMISTGVLTRKFELIPIEYLALFYFTMGTPLLISAFGFLRISKNN